MDILKSMGDAIRYRGPDDRGIYSGIGTGLGNQRLSIIDIAGGHQPFISEDGKVVVVQNGEIFNHIELSQELASTEFSCRTKSDTEVILRLYQKEGISFVSKLNGMFAIAIYDAREDALYLIRDRVGVKPLYTHYDGVQLTFGSEIKALLPALRKSPVTSQRALSQYLTFNYIPPPLTIYEGVEHLMPGCILKVSLAGVRLTRWWNLAEIAPILDRNESDWIEELVSILTDAVRLRLRSDVPFGAFLSGGVDSSTIVALMRRNTAAKIKTFCIGFKDERYDESKYAQRASDRFGTDHVAEVVDTEILALWRKVIYHCDQPHGDASFIPTFKVSELASRHVKVVLTGDGGDEIFGGYEKYNNIEVLSDEAGKDDALFLRKYVSSISIFSEEEKASLFSGRRVVTSLSTDSLELADRHFREVKHQDRINQALYLDMQMLLPGNNLVKPDRMGMAVSIEARTPLLDYRMVEFAFRMPGSLKIRNGVLKYIFKKAVGSLIGEDLISRRKQMFTVPVGEWFKAESKVYLENLVKENIFNRDRVKGLIEDHLISKRDRTRQLRALIAYSHWLGNQ